jgi:hypothetical protein
MTPIPVPPPIQGPFWSIVAPIALFLIAFGATVALYRHFSGRAAP